MSCEHPVRVYNKYIDKYLFVPCGKCNTCLNRKAMYWTNQCEKERRNSMFTMFVTLTYDELSLPVYNVSGGFDYLNKIEEGLQKKQIRYLQSIRLHDTECMALDTEKLFDEDADKELFFEFLKGKGIPYASKSDIQLFHKRLNKWFFQNVTNKYQNFRFFLVSELGSTTLRPHFHALYFINDSEVARRFNEGILASWQFGRIDCQYVENSACSYVAQYINKLHDLPSFYKAKQIRPFYLCSRSPIIGNVVESTQSDEEIFNSGTVQTFSYRRKDSRLVLVELDKSTENRIYPKCPCFSQISNSLRVELYSAVCRFKCATFQGFKDRVKVFLDDLEYKFKVSDFVSLLREKVDGFSVEGEEWLRRLYYLSRKAFKNALRFGISIFAYVQKIDEYYKNKELHLINKMYEFQEQYMENENNSPSVDDLVLMYPDFLHDVGFSLGEWLNQFTPKEVKCMRSDAASLAYSNKSNHFKNQYLDSLVDKGDRFYKSLKNYFYAKKRYEISEAFAS